MFVLQSSRVEVLNRAEKAGDVGMHAVPGLEGGRTQSADEKPAWCILCIGIMISEQPLPEISHQHLCVRRRVRPLIIDAFHYIDLALPNSEDGSVSVDTNTRRVFTVLGHPDPAIS